MRRLTAGVVACATTLATGMCMSVMLFRTGQRGTNTWPPPLDHWVDTLSVPTHMSLPRRSISPACQRYLIASWHTLHPLFTPFLQRSSCGRLETFGAVASETAALKPARHPPDARRQRFVVTTIRITRSHGSCARAWLFGPGSTHLFSSSANRAIRQ